MNNVVHINFEEKNNAQTNCPSFAYSTDVERLSYVVLASAKSIYMSLGPGLPKCLYQLNLYNDLSRRGLSLKTEMSMLNHCVKQEPDRELIIVNDTLVIECVVENIIIDHFQKRVMFDLENTSHTKGMLINFSDAMQADMATIIDSRSVFH